MTGGRAGTALGIRARSEPLPADTGDLLLELLPDDLVVAAPDLVLVGRGRALVLPLPGGTADAAAVADQLAAVPVEDPLRRPGTGVVALGALPFDRRAPGHLVVPEVLLGQDAAGHRWMTTVSPAAETPDPAGDAPPTRPARRPPADFEELVARALEHIERGEAAKVVLARQIAVDLPEPADVPVLLARWRQVEPACTVFSVPLGAGRFVGASPELLVSRRGRRVTSRPLAGTRGAAGGEGLLASAKDTAEHRFVVDAIAEGLGPRCVALDVPAAPSVVRLHTVSHLQTAITGTLAPRADGTVPGALDLVADLHPTPAVGGTPRRRALALIAELEEQDRGPYAGPVGWVDGRGDGDWMVGIRAAVLEPPGAGETGPSRAVVTAGVGIVAGSDPAAELRETELKLAAVLDVLAPGGGRPR